MGQDPYEIGDIWGDLSDLSFYMDQIHKVLRTWDKMREEETDTGSYTSHLKEDVTEFMSSWSSYRKYW